MKKTKGKLVRVPMRFVDGKWVFEYGGEIIASEGTQAELVIEASKLTDRLLADELLQNTRLKILDQGTKLRVMLHARDRSGLSTEQCERLLNFDKVKHEFEFGALDGWVVGPPSFIEVIVGRPIDEQRRLFNNEKGGVWIRLEGLRSVGLISSSIELPADVSAKPAISLNHAFTFLSEVYEPWRLSHTGNVYTRFFYQEKDGRWNPLELLRNARIAKREQEIAFNLWQELLEIMRSREGSSS